MTIEDYLHDLRRHGLRDKRSLEEVRLHLEEAAAEVGEEQAVSQFGDSRTIARSLRGRPLAALSIALVAGAAIGYVDSRPGWDDTGVSALFILVTTAILAFWKPRFAWCSALLVGGFIPLIEGLGDGNGGSLLALAVAAIGSGVGWLASRASAAGSKALRS